MGYDRFGSTYAATEISNACSKTGRALPSRNAPAKTCETVFFMLAAWACVPFGPVFGTPISIPGSTATVTPAIYTASYADLFDVAQGATIVSASPTQGSADGLLGGSAASVEVGNTLFADGSPAGTVHSIVFSLASPVVVNAISLALSQDGSLPKRGASGYSLLGLQSPTDIGVVLSTATFPDNYETAYGYNNIIVEDQFPAFTGQFFRFDVVQRTDYFGPRVQELDGFAVPVPEPSTYAMALAGLACGGWHVFRPRRRRTAYGVCRSLVALLLVTCSLMAGLVQAAPITMDMVTVGNPGNAADTTGYGAVTDVFKIAKYETTVDQYVAFLNANAKTDRYGLYDGRMSTFISTRGGDGNRIYASQAFMGNKPISYVDWFSAARFANWMHNGQVPDSTEMGAYTMNGVYHPDGVERNAGAKFWLPSEDEWYKTAYCNADDATYYLYPTGKNEVPGKATYDAAGVGLAGAVGNFANYSVVSGDSATITDVGTNGGPSPYGAFDLGGNVWEWNDTGIIVLSNGSTPIFHRGLRGGDIFDGAFWLRSTSRYSLEPSADAGYGFRVAAVPEPSTCAMALAGLACGGYSIFRRRRTR